MRRLGRRLLHAHHNVLRPRRRARTRHRDELGHLIPRHQHRQAVSPVSPPIGGEEIGFGGRGVGIGVRQGLTKGSELIPVIAAGEDAAEAEDDDKKEGCAEREAERGTRGVHVRR